MLQPTERSGREPRIRDVARPEPILVEALGVPLDDALVEYIDIDTIGC